MGIQETLINWSDSLSISGFFVWIMRNIAGGIVEILGQLVDVVYKGMLEIYSLLDFIKSDVLEEAMGDYLPLVKILMVLSITFFGLFLLFKKSDNAMNISQNLLIIMLVVVALPQFADKTYNLTSSSIQFSQSQYSKESSLTYNIVKNNIIDLAKVDDKYGVDGLTIKYEEVNKKRSANNSITPENWKLMRGSWSTEEINPDETKSKMWSKKLSIDENGEVVLSDLSSGWFSWDEAYYRYNVLWGTLIFTLLTTALAIIFSSIKTARIIFEIGWTQGIAAFFAVTDISGGQRIKELLKHIVSSLATLFLISVMMGFYFMSLAFLSTKDIGAFAYVITLFALAWLLIDGPNIIERIIGSDVGISSGYRTLATIAAAGMTGKAMTLGGKKGVQNMVKAATIGTKTSTGRKGGALRVAGKTGASAYRFGKQAKEEGVRDTLRNRFKRDENDNTSKNSHVNEEKTSSNSTFTSKAKRNATSSSFSEKIRTKEGAKRPVKENYTKNTKNSKDSKGIQKDSNLNRATRGKSKIEPVIPNKSDSLKNTKNKK